MAFNVNGTRVLSVAALALLATARASIAQEDAVTPAIQAPEATVEERQSVLQRPRPDYDPLGIRVGSFLLFPTGQISESVDSNVFATTKGQKSDFFTTFSPGVALQSDWNVHSLGFRASSDTKRYVTQVSENYTNYAFRGDGRYDVLRDIYISGGAGYQTLHEDRSSPDTVNGKQPVEYHLTSANIGYTHEPGRLGARITATADNYDFNNATSSNGTTISQQDRNRIVYTVTPRVFYEIVPGYHAFLQAIGNERDYVRTFDARGFQRSSRGWEVDVGTAIDFTHVINGEVYGGYLSQSYEDSRLVPSSGFALGANLLWNVTQLTSLRGTLARTVEETTQFATVGGAVTDASGFLQTVVKLALEHELMSNVLLASYVSYTNSDYSGIVRTDNEWDADVSGRYLINRILTASVDVTYQNRSSNIVGVPFDRVVGMVALKAGF